MTSTPNHPTPTPFGDLASTVRPESGTGKHADTLGLLRIGTKTQMCVRCGAYFTTESNGDRHRVGPWEARRCLTPEEMTEAGLVLNGKGIWQQPGREEGR